MSDIVMKKTARRGGNRIKKSRADRIFDVIIYTIAGIMTLLALSIGNLLGGTAIIESIFMWDGVGKLAVDAITMRDYPVIQGFVLIMATIYVFINLGTDIIYRAIDPRIELE